MTQLWIRAEVRSTEQRAPIVPSDAARLIADGMAVTVEESPHRAFPLGEYTDAGCRIAAAGAWVEAPADAYVLGIKELPDTPDALRHTHIYFAHAYKGQSGADELLGRFRRGGGELLDVEYLSVAGRRVVAFGHWAGYMGAALGLLAVRGSLSTPVRPMTKTVLDAVLSSGTAPVRALVTGAGGRSGRGAIEALRAAGAEVTAWDLAETRDLDRAALLEHDLLVNCVVTREPAEPFVRPEDVGVGRLSVVADVTCDVTSSLNLIPVNTEVTTWDAPIRRISSASDGSGHSLQVLAIDNLPSLLPREASESFSAELTLLLLSDDRDGRTIDARTGAWSAAAEEFTRRTS